MIEAFVAMVVTLIVLNRYVLPMLSALLRPRALDEALPQGIYLPKVTVVMPCFNEGKFIFNGIKALLVQDYPSELLNICVVDDCSRDDSFDWATRAASEAQGRVTVLRNPKNLGKRRSINRAVEAATAEIIVSVDSDVILSPDAISQLVRRFVNPKIAAVGGRVFVYNAQYNWLTKMQAIKYFFGYEYLKSLERRARKVMCLSGCLTAYRRSVLLEIHDILENRQLLGIPIKYGEDRFLTRQIVKRGYDTVLTLDAKCRTNAPTTLSGYFAQQLRWRRSNLVDYLGGITHLWKLPPTVALHYGASGFLLVTYPGVMVAAFAAGKISEFMALHLLVLFALSLVYWIHSRRLPECDRVNPLHFMWMAILMPATYVVLTPLAAFTLDSGTWETRGHK